MTIAVTDACIFIDVFMLELHEHFFDLQLSLHTTLEVIGELHAEQQAMLASHHKNGRLTIHILTEAKRHAIAQTTYPRSLSEPDKTVLHIASELQAMVLSSDKVMRNCAKKLNLEYHGILWIIEHMVDQQKLNKTEGIHKLDQLLRINPTMPGSKEVMKRVNEIKNTWSEEE